MTQREGLLRSAVALAGSALMVGLMVSLLVPEVRRHTGRTSGDQTAGGPSLTSPSHRSSPHQADEDTGQRTPSSGTPPPQKVRSAPQDTDGQDNAPTPSDDQAAPERDSDSDVDQAAPPWADVLQDAKQPPEFQSICFDDFDARRSLPSVNDLHRWFDNVPGKSGSITKARTRLGECGAISGWLRLKCPWAEDTALRLSLENYNQIRMHFFHGGEGVTLVYYESDQYRWAAYSTSREDDSPAPRSWALTATDDGRCRRTEIRYGGPFEVRHREDELILSRGDIILLRAPLAGPPDAVYFEGKASFHGIQLLRDRGFPRRRETPPATIEHPRPADLPWISQLDAQAKFEADQQGNLTLTAESAGKRGQVVVPLPRDGVYETVLQLQGATPGTGVVLLRADGRRHEFVRFVENRRDKSLCVMLRGNDDQYSADLGEVKERLVARAASRQWVRLLYGCGTLRWWISSDGLHWAETHDTPMQTPGDVSHVGLHHVAGRPGCRIMLSRISFRRLDRVSGLADRELLRRAASVIDVPNLSLWSERIKQKIPDDVSPKAWSRACAIRSLASGCSRQLGQELIGWLIDDFVKTEPAAEVELGLLDELTRLVSVRDDQARLTEWIARYYDLARRHYERSGRLPYSLIRKPVMSLGLCEQVNVRVASPELIRIDLLHLAYDARWRELLDYCQRLKYFQQMQQVPLGPWAESLARSELPGVSGRAPQARRDQWRHPYEEQLSKRAYNVLAELNALLKGESFVDAAQAIAAIDPASVQGVAPISSDRSLLVSLPAAVRLHVREHPELHKVLVERFGPLAELRVRQAIAAGDVAAVRLAAIQFDATPAAAEANLWLGDRALSAGWFAQALALFQRAEQTASIALTSELQPRIRLAAAMLGKNGGERIRSEVRFGSNRVSEADFEATIESLIQRGGPARASSSLPAGQDRTASARQPAPARLKPHTRSRLDGPVGQQPNVEVLRHVRRFLVPWVERQIACVQHGKMLYISNRFQIAAYDLGDGQRKWRSQNPSGSMLRAQDWSLTPMQPLVVGDFIIARLLYNKAPVLVCLRRDSGQTVWIAEQRSNELLISDPLEIQDQLCVLSLDRTDANRQVVRLNILALDNGQLLRQEDVLLLRSSWSTRRYCRATPLEDGLVASFGGLSVRLDLDGEPRWIRTQIVVPAEEEAEWVQQYFDPPRLVGDRLFIAEPSVRTVQCVDPNSGRLVWSRTLPDLQRVMTVDESRLVVARKQGLLALDSRSGRKLWQRPLTGLLHGTVRGAEGVLVVSQKSAVPNRPDVFIPQLTWIRIHDGATVATIPLAGLAESPDPRFGPLLQHEGRLWTMYGRGHDDANRDLVELIPEG